MRKLVLCILFGSFVIVSVTGVFLSLRFPRFFNYKAIHEMFSYIFLISSFMHIYFNRKAITHYLMRRR
ncbi:DUF4405 domain-containing protein [Pectinatus frisingensis]